LGALLLVEGVYVLRDSLRTSSVANGQVAQANRTIVNWDVAANRLERAEDARARRLDQDLVQVTTAR